MGKTMKYLLVCFLLLMTATAGAKVKQLVIPSDTELFSGFSYRPDVLVPNVNITQLRGEKYKLAFPKQDGMSYYCSFDGSAPSSEDKLCPKEVTLKGANVVKMIGLSNERVLITATQTVLMYDSIDKKINQKLWLTKIPTIAGVMKIYKFSSDSGLGFDVVDVVLNGRLVARYENTISLEHVESSNMIGGEWQLIALAPSMAGNMCNSWGMYIYAVSRDRVLNSTFITSCGSYNVGAKTLPDGSLRVTFPAYTGAGGGRFPADVYRCDGENITLLSGLKSDIKDVTASDSIYKPEDVDKADGAGEIKYLALNNDSADVMNKMNTASEGLLGEGADASQENVVDAILGCGGENRKNGNGAAGDSDRMGGMGGVGFGTGGRAGWGTGNGGTRQGKRALGAGGTGKGISTRSNADSSKMSSQKSDTEAVAGSRSPESILRVIRAHIGGFQYIYQKYLKLNPNIGGKLSLKFTISAPGDIIAISVASSNTGSAELDDEIKDKARRMKFDPIEKGNVTVTYAIVLNKD